MGDTSTIERPVPPIDPRIRARRIEVQRGEGRRRLARLIDVGLVLAVALGFLLALRSPLLDVDQVTVAGADQTGAAAVLEAAAIEAGTPLMDVDLGAAGERVAALPWVDEVELHRRLDGTIALTVVERRPAAIAGTGDDAVLVDVEGRALVAAGAEADAELVRLEGVAVPPPGGQIDAAAQPALPLAALLAEAAPGAVASLRVDDLVGVLASGGEVHFDDTSQLQAKVRSLRTVLAQVDLHCLGVLDVGSPGSPVLTREEGCS